MTLAMRFTFLNSENINVPVKYQKHVSAVTVGSDNIVTFYPSNEDYYACAPENSNWQAMQLNIFEEILNTEDYQQHSKSHLTEAEKSHGHFHLKSDKPITSDVLQELLLGMNACSKRQNKQKDRSFPAFFREEMIEKMSGEYQYVLSDLMPKLGEFIAIDSGLESVKEDLGLVNHLYCLKQNMDYAQCAHQHRNSTTLFDNRNYRLHYIARSLDYALLLGCMTMVILLFCRRVPKRESNNKPNFKCS